MSYWQSFAYPWYGTIKALASHRKLAWLQRLYAKRLATWNVASLRFFTFSTARKGCSCRLLGLKLRSDHCRILLFLQSQRLDPSEVVTLTRSRASFCLMRPTPWQLHIAPCMTMARTYLWDCRLYKRYIISYYIYHVRLLGTSHQKSPFNENSQ